MKTDKALSMYLFCLGCIAFALTAPFAYILDVLTKGIPSTNREVARVWQQIKFDFRQARRGQF
jgi:hypothetical protein